MKTKKHSLLPAAIIAAATALSSTVGIAQTPFPESGDGVLDSTPPTAERPTMHVEVRYDAAADIEAVRSVSFDNRTAVATDIRSSLQQAAGALLQVRTEIESERKVFADAENLQDALRTALDARVDVTTSLTTFTQADVDRFDAARSGLIDSLETFASATAELQAELQ